MNNNQASHSVLSVLIPILVAVLGSKGVFYYFSFEYSIFSDPFDIQKLCIDIGVFLLLFYLGTLLAKTLINTWNKPAD